jgi:hypothetical protein
VTSLTICIVRGHHRYAQFYADEDHFILPEVFNPIWCASCCDCGVWLGPFLSKEKESENA